MKFLNFDTQKQKYPLFIAEISCSHLGSLDNALKLIDLAKTARADIVKIQAYTPDEMCFKHSGKIQKGLWKGANLYSLYQKAQTPLDWIPYIFNYAKEIDVPIFSSVFGPKSLQALEKAGCQAYKIASFEANDYNLIKNVMKTQKPMLISTGCLTNFEVFQLEEQFYSHYPHMYMHCVSKYPCKDEDAQLHRIKILQELYGDIGYSDHTKGCFAPSIAASFGAKVIEKHFYDPRLGKSEDAKFSIDYKQFKNMVEKVRHTIDMCTFNPKDNMNFEFKRSVYATKRINKGEYFTEDNTAALRPYKGLDARMLPKLVEKAKSNTLILPGTPIIGDYVQWQS